MKKLTCGMFAAILGLCTAGAANAKIASQGYVDQQTGALSGLSTTEKTNLVGAINEVNAAVDAIDNSIADYETIKTNVSTNTTNIGKNTDAITKLNGDESVDGSVANKIATATTDMATNASVANKIATATANMQTTTNLTTSNTVTADKGSDTKYTSVAAAEAIANAAVATVTTDVSGLKEAVANTYDKTTADGKFQAKTDSTVATGTYNYITAGTGVAANLTALDTGTKAAKDAADAAKTAADAAQTAADAAQADATQALTNAATAQTAANNAQTTANEAKAAAATAQGTADSAVSAAAAAQSTADTAKGAAEAAQGTADSAVSAAAKAQTTADAAKTTADKAIPKPSDDCDNPTNYCVLTYNNTGYVWEVITRGDNEVVSGN